MTAATDRRTTAWEQHFSTIANAVVVSGILFLGTQVWSTNNKLTEFTLTNKYLAETVQELKVQLRELNNNYVKRVEYMELDNRVRKLESK